MNPRVKWYEALCYAYGIDPADPNWCRWAEGQWESFFIAGSFSKFKRAFVERYESAKFAADLLRRRGPSA